jgi:hypothetical protein
MLYKEGKVAVKTLRLLCEAYSNEALNKMVPCEWHQHLKLEELQHMLRG